MTGRFITFEGTEGCGKSTQNKRLMEYLTQRGHDVLCTREPGGTDFGSTIREIILNPETTFHHYHTELLLFIADRLEHVESVIKPALAEGKVVLCDRFVDSTIAYQMGGRKVDPGIVGMLNKLVDMVPEQTFLLDIDPVEGLRRAKKRADLDRFEQEEIDFHIRIRETYLYLASVHPDRMIKIDVNGKSEEDVFSLIQSSLGGWV